MSAAALDVFVTGASGFMGRRLCEALAARGHRVTGLVRAGAEARAPRGVTVATGDPLDRSTFSGRVARGAVVVSLVGVTHPNPAKADQFRTVDLAAAREAFAAARDSTARSVVYVSVAQPAPVMKSYVEARREAEETLRATGLPATILRPWYVLGPGRRWPMLILPLYWLLERLPPTRASALRLGFVTAEQMIAALVRAVERAPQDVEVWDVPAIRRESCAP